ncbi:site-specific integrase [Lactobacillus delbrueckii subsp. lactis]|uniref:site-specific integrase n=1 Tax=Lactobacillus delbrueckii TaxID=1584 RepID=UPI001E541CD2|nr:site-specific integrase [Lactobacillus delbrueckii]MCD5569629.1 site-specific integrase [Lactobacillus delbrueckii subsp. lactis]
MTQQIKRYKTPGGKTRYKFSLSAGQDHATDKSIMIRRQGFKSKQEAQRALSDVLKAIANDEYRPLSERRLTFRQFYEQVFLPQYKREVRESTLRTFTVAVGKRILPLLGDVYLDKLEPLRCQQAVNKWVAESKSYKQTKTYASIIVDRAAKMGVIEDNPFKKVTLPRKKESKKPTNFYTKAELEKFLATAEKEEPLKYYALMCLLADTGMRDGEALALTWSDVDLAKGCVSITKSLARVQGKFIIGDTKTPAAHRVIYLLPKTVQVLTDYHEQQVEYFAKGDQDRLFPFVPSTVETHVKQVAKSAGLHKITPHGFRHTSSSLQVAAGLTPAQIKDRLGHESFQTTMNIYVHTGDEAQAAAAKALGKYFNK